MARTRGRRGSADAGDVRGKRLFSVIKDWGKAFIGWRGSLFQTILKHLSKYNISLKCFLYLGTV